MGHATFGMVCDAHGAVVAKVDTALWIAIHTALTRPRPCAITNINP
jgi:hypothetical protein